jgi:hypothetical protein
VAGRDRRRPLWRQDVATNVAVVGLLVTMVFNTIGVWQQVDQTELAGREAARAADQARQTRIDTQVQLITQLNALSAEAEREVVAAGVDIAQQRIDFEATAHQRAAVSSAARYYDYLAWLFNERQVVLGSAQSYSTESMVKMYELAIHTFGFKEAQRTYPELRRFAVAVHRDEAP